MSVSISDPAIAAPASSPSATAEMDLTETVAVLEELLSQSIALRDLYRSARRSTSGLQYVALHQLFDAHYRAQVELVDVLIERTRALGGTSRVFGGDFLRAIPCTQSLHGRAGLTKLLGELLEAHDTVLTAASPAGANDLQRKSWLRDFAVGQVVLTNNLQRTAVSEQLTSRAGCRESLRARASETFSGDT
ncbi:MAG TPA: ferritin-like domain-containing protein [Steroidobacteraceae bacterium]|nr:ferritin-like domain-containing protein [Steroidobacteraceae bacterium]